MARHAYRGLAVAATLALAAGLSLVGFPTVEAVVSDNGTETQSACTPDLAGDTLRDRLDQGDAAEVETRMVEFGDDTVVLTDQSFDDLLTHVVETDACPALFGSD